MKHGEKNSFRSHRVPQQINTFFNGNMDLASIGKLSLNNFNMFEETIQQEILNTNSKNKT